LRNIGKDTLHRPLIPLSAQASEPAALEKLLVRRAVFYFLAFTGFCVLIAIEATQGVDQWVFSFTSILVSEPLDVVSSLVSLLGNFEVSSAVTLAVAALRWRRQGLRGLAPLLLFVGVAIEVILKFYLPHPGPPQGFSRNKHFLPPLRFSTPYSFPSGHMLRAAFLATFLFTSTGKWRTLGWIFVLAMAITRPYLNEHWTSDVIGGFLLGQAFAWIAVAIGMGGTTTMRGVTSLRGQRES
jgi:undecaprenyl-diphosphatase